MDVSELITISVDDDKWLDVANGTSNARQYIDKPTLMDYMALKADDFFDGGEGRQDQIDDNILSDFDASDCIGMTADEILNDYLSEMALHRYFVEQNELYCEEHDCCYECRTKLITDEDTDEIVCPNGC